MSILKIFWKKKKKLEWFLVTVHTVWNSVLLLLLNWPISKALETSLSYCYKPRLQTYKNNFLLIITCFYKVLFLISCSVDFPPVIAIIFINIDIFLTIVCFFFCKKRVWKIKIEIFLKIHFK